MFKAHLRDLARSWGESTLLGRDDMMKHLGVVSYVCLSLKFDTWLKASVCERARGFLAWQLFVRLVLAAACGGGICPFVGLGGTWPLLICGREIKKETSALPAQ